MKSKLTALALTAVTALSLGPKPALASDKGLAVLGGFIGGVIVASAISDSHYDNYPAASTVVVNDRGNDCRPAGYWEVVNVRVWVPGYWIVERSHHGRSYRRYVDGHNEYRTDRVWVTYDRRDRHGREVSYGYGRR